MQNDLAAELARAVAILNKGGVVAFPTDTVYGLGALADNPVAICRVFEIKERPLTQALPLLVADIAQAASVVHTVPAVAQLLMEHFWPGALTLVLPCATWVPKMITAGGSTVAVRVPAHPLTLALMEAVGRPLVGTSANVHGLPSPVTAEEVRAQLSDRVDFIIDGGRTPGGIESTIVDMTVSPPQILRHGMIKREDIEKVVTGLW
ncbi:MAG: L-threonylcarbamoyladenylate synthase [Dehalococcoidia bacterium]|nr:L-threonylcarbamoyladenylate synthase [Dehalococcoidia bacterium]